MQILFFQWRKRNVLRRNLGEPVIYTGEHVKSHVWSFSGDWPAYIVRSHSWNVEMEFVGYSIT